MKKIKIIYYLILVLFIGSSCEKMIELEPISNYSFKNMWQNEGEANSAIIGIYNQMQTVFRTNYAYWGEGRSDLLYRYNNSDEALFLLNNSLVATMGSCNWNPLYKVISRANFALKYIPQVPEATFTLASRNRLRGEAFYARALSYFYIVRVWGEAPLITFPYDSDTLKFEVPKDPVDKIWNQIKADLDSASLYLPNEHFSESSYSFDNFRFNRGRATRAAVWATQTDMFMWRKEYQKADSVAFKFETLTRYYNASSKKWNLTPNFADICVRRDKLIPYPTEGVFELQFNKDEGVESDMSNLWHANFNTYGPNDKFLNLFEPGDIRASFYHVANGKNYKFFGIGTTIANINKDQNIIIYRLSDVLLLRAEALNKLGDKAKAISLMNVVRARVGLPASMLTVSSSNDEIETAILNERAKELCGEGKRWFDLVRTGKAISTMQPINGLSDPRNIYWPIHADNIRANSKLEQNSFYVTAE